MDRLVTPAASSHDENLPPAGRKTEAVVGQEFSSYPSFPLPPPSRTPRRALYLPLFLKLSSPFTPRPGGWVGDSPPPTPRTGVSVVRGEKESGVARSVSVSPGQENPPRPGGKEKELADERQRERDREKEKEDPRKNRLSVPVYRAIAILYFAATFQRT